MFILGSLVFALIIITMPALLIMGDKVCAEKCATNSENSEYIFKNACGAKNISVPIKLVSSCLQCDDKKGYLTRSSMSFGLTYPDFIPVEIDRGGDTSGSRDISIHISNDNLSCDPNPEQTSSSIGYRLTSSFSSPPNAAAAFVNIEGDFYKSRESSRSGHSADLYFSKSQNGLYEYLIECDKLSCGSFPNPIYGTPYRYSYGFASPADPRTIQKIHRAVNDYIKTIHPIP